MEEVCELIANNWSAEFNVQYIEQTLEDDMKAVSSNESAVEYIITQLNICFGNEISEIVSNEDSSMVSFKFKGVNFTIYEWFNSRGSGYWVVDVV